MLNMNKEKVNRQFSNTIEILATEKEWWNFPKSFDTNKEFKILDYKNDMLTFEVREGIHNLGSFLVFVSLDFDYAKLEGTGERFMMSYFSKKVSKEMFVYHKAQLRG